MSEQPWIWRAWEQTDAEIDQYIAATKDLQRTESLEELRARLIRQRDEALERHLSGVDLPYISRIDGDVATVVRPGVSTVPGRVTMTFTTLNKADA